MNALLALPALLVLIFGTARALAWCGDRALDLPFQLWD